MADYWTSTGKTPTEVMAAVGREGLEGERLFRALAGVNGWSSPIGARGLPLIHEGRLSLFSNDAILQVHCETHGLASELFVSMPGYGAFACSNVTAIDVDPGDPGGLTFEGRACEALQRIAETTAIEAFLHGAKDIDLPFARMRNYTDYRVLTNQGQWMLAPDSENRKLVAICTSPATERSLQEQVVRELGHETTTLVLTGAELFARIQKLPAQGMVFNPCGPVQPRAMSLQLAEIVLNRND